MRELVRRLRWLFHREQFDQDLEEEMRHHLALKAESTGAEQAHRQFGNVTLLKEDSRAAWTFVFWEQLAQDVRYGLRTMAANKLFSAMAVLSLALGIGANTAIYSFLDTILLRSLPVDRPEQLVLANWVSNGRPAVIHGLNGTMHDDKDGNTSPNFPYAAYETLRANKDVVDNLFAFSDGVAHDLNVVARNQAEVLHGLYVSGNFFSGLGMAPAMGRLIAEEDDKAGAAPVTVIAYKYWQSRFASDPSVIGQSILVNSTPVTIAGVAAPGFFGVDSSVDVKVFLPLHMISMFSRGPGAEPQMCFPDKNYYWVEMMGRLQPGVRLEQAQSVFAPIFQSYVEGAAETADEKITPPVLRLQAGGGGLDSLRRQYSGPLCVLMAMVGLILVIACTNIANLLLARGTARRRELAIRASLGAGRRRVIRQLLTESLLLSLGGGALGMVVAVWAIRGITVLLSAERPNLALHATLDWTVLAFTATLALLTGTAFGLVPALQATSGSVAPNLADARISEWSGRSRVGVSQVLLTMQIAISLLLVVAAALFVRTLSNLHSVELGFNRENLLIFSMNARKAGYKDLAIANLYRDLANRFRHIPGVRSAGFSSVPLAVGFWNDTPLSTPRVQSPDGKKPHTCVLSIDESFLSTMQIPVLLGRGIEERDVGGPRVAVVTELFAKKFFPDQNPIGQQIGFGVSSGYIRIVGVAKTSIYNSLKEHTPPVVYLPYTQSPMLNSAWFELRTVGDPLAIGSAVQQIAHQAGPNVPVTNLTTQAAQIDQTIGQERTFAALCTCFALLALAVACVGLYGTMSYAVERRTREVGIRMALGAPRPEIVWMMLRRILALAATGLAIGSVAAWALSRFVAPALFGVKPTDPFAFYGSAALLLAVTLLAGYAPARRAARVDPMVALRNG